MSKKFIKQESERWAELDIISTDQQKQILELYEEREHAIGLIPLLGSILVGLGILSFIAANWQDIPQLLRLSMIIIMLTGFYISGEMMIKKGQEKLGISLISLGLISFGAGVILIAQMFQLEAYNVTSWAIWATVGVLLTYLYQSRYLFLLTTLLLSITQLVSVLQFQTFSYLTLAVTLIGLGYYIWKNKDTLLSWLFGISFIVQSFMFFVSNEWKIIWFFIPVFALYTLVDLMKEHKKYYYPFQSAALITGFIFALFIVFVGDDMYFDKYDDLLTESIFLFIAMALLFLVSLYYKVKSDRTVTAVDWILAPILLYLPIHEDILYLLILFIFSLFQLWRGYVEEWRFKINLGTVMFLISTMVAYGKLTWNFMDKSLFFILGGIILLLLSWFLNRRRKQFIEHEEVDDHA